MVVDKVSFNGSCDYLLDQITVELLNADVNDENQIKILTDNAKRLREAKTNVFGGVLDWFKQLTPGDILKLGFSVLMYTWILNKEDEGIVVTTRATNFLPWNKFPR